MKIALNKLVAFMVTVAVFCAPALCNCVEPPRQPIAAESHGCCRHSEGKSTPRAPVSNGDQHRSDDCNHCNPTLRSALAEQHGHQPALAFDAVHELPLDAVASLLVSEPHLSDRAPVGVIPPLLLDLFHICTSLLN